jgi:DtxR family Mn-dependent transcriptional regulator
MLSRSVEDYLKALFELSREGRRATTGALAERLGVAPASVTGMLRKLSSREPKWVLYAKHRGARLTEAGRLRALKIIRHHRLVELYLHTALGFDWDEVHAEAEQLEHAVSEAFEDRIAEHLGQPEADPHGHPIPRKDGSLPERTEVRLSDVRPGREAVISQVSDRDPALLRRLGELGLYPRARVRVVASAPSGGSITLRVGGKEHPLEREAASHILATQAAQDEHA